MKHRWPSSIHSQIEAVFHSIRSFRDSKIDAQQGIRSFGTWKVYKYEAHRFAKHLQSRNRANLVDTAIVQEEMNKYLEKMLTQYTQERRSRQTMKTILAAMGKLEYAINNYIKQHGLDIIPMTTEKLRATYSFKAKKLLPQSSKKFINRAFPNPTKLIEAISDGTFQLQASLQYEGGLRTEGVGAPSNRKLKNPLTQQGLKGVGIDPVTKKPAGIVASVEKGGKETAHYISERTYRRLERYIQTHGKLESDYNKYIDSINQAAHKTDQYAPGRGSHGLKHNFAQERYHECIVHGLTHEQALQQTSLETSHFRLSETLTYTRG